MKLIENGAVVKQGGVREVFNGASDKYLTSVGTPDAGVHGTPYYENVANVQNGIVGNRGGIYGLDDFVKNNTDVYFNRDGMTEEDKIVTNKLYDKIKSSTQNVFAFRPRDFDIGNTYVVEFDTVGDTEAPLYYIAGMKSYEKIPTGRFMHKSYQQWYGVQERYNITVDTSILKTTFLKGTGIGTLDTKAGLESSAVTIEDTYTNTKFNPGSGDIGEYNTYKSTGNYSHDYHKQFHNRFVRDFRGGEDGINVTADRSKGNHTLYIEADVRNQKINFRLPYKVVTQSDIYQPVAKAATGVKDYTGNLGAASDYITEYRYNSVPGFKEPDSADMGTPSPGLSFYKDRISDFPKTSARIKEQSVKSVEWVGGTNDLTTGTRVIELTVENGRKELFKVPYYIDVVPGGTISAENVAKLNAAIREAYQKVDTNGNVSGTVPAVTSTTPVWVQKQIKVTYYDNENNDRTNNQDDSVDYVDILFKNIRKEATPTAPEISVPEDGSASVTPKGTTDKLVVSYRPTDQNADTTITVKKSGTTWGAVDTLPNGVTVNPSNGVVSITEPTVKDLSTITAKATYLNSDEASATDTVKTPDNVAPTVSFNGKALTKDADATRFIIYRGANFNPTFRVQDNKNNVNLSITGLPKGVGDISKNGSKEFDYTISGNPVAIDAPLEERIATVVATDARNNTATYKFKYRIVDVQASSTETRPVGSKLGDPHSQFKVADSASSDNDKYYPEHMQFKWKEFNSSTFKFTDISNDTKLNEVGNVTKYTATAVFPNTVNKKTIDGVEYTIYTPIQKAVQKTFNVTDSVAPTVKLTNLITKNETVLTNTVPTSTDGTDGTAITIFRGAKLVLPLKFSDNASEGRVNVQYVSGLPKGVSFGGSNNKLTFTGANETNPTTHTVEGKVAADATLGYSTVTLKVSDSKDGDVSKGNQSEVKFRVRVLDLDFEPGRVAEPNQSSTTINATKGQNLEDANNYLTVNSGTNRQDQNNFPSGMTFRMVDSTTNTVISKLPDAPGRYVVKARAYFPVDYAGTNEVSEVVTGNSDKQLNGRRYLEKTINFVVKPIAPTVTPKDNGDVLITPTNKTNVDKVSVTFTPQEGTNPAEVTYTAKKNASGVWEFGSGAPLTVDPTTGVFRLKDRVVKDGTTVTAKALTTDGTGSVESNPATGIAGNGDAIYPTVTYTNNVETDAQGNHVVYITPTEVSNVDVATVGDNSGKLLEAVIFDQGTTLLNIGNYGLDYNKLVRNGDTITNAPYTLTVTGTLNKFKSGSTLWNDGDVITTRYVSAMDAAENNLKEDSTNRRDNASNPYRIVFKVRTQAAKYEPTANTLTRTDQQAKHTNAQVLGAVSGTNIARKEIVGNIPNEAGVAVVKVTYNDGSKENVKVPITVTPSDATTIAPTVTPLTRHDQAPKHTADQVTGAVTGDKITGKKVIGEIPDGTGEVTVEVTYEDGSKENVKVPILVVGLPSKTPAKNASNLTPDEKEKVKAKVLEKNPGKQVTVGDDGTATVKDPNTGITHSIPGTELVNQDFTPVKPTDKVPVKDVNNLSKDEQDKVKESVEKANPGKTVVVEPTGKVIITDPKTNISHELSGEEVTTILPPVLELPEYTDPIGTTGVDENGNLILPPVAEHPTLLITKWVDENGNELKPADAKAPSVLGEANEAFEHGEIEGYVFVRTETKDDVVTHVFRKVSPVRPTGDGLQRPTTPSDDTNPRPDTVTPAEVPAAQPQAVLPNTGTQENHATGALGVLSLLGALGLLATKKKKDDEEEA